MLQRHLWVSFLEAAAAPLVSHQLAIRQEIIREHIATHGIVTGALFQHQHTVYGYCESDRAVDMEHVWRPIMGDLLQHIPTANGIRCTMALPDIYHDGAPSTTTPWRQPGYQPTKRVGSLARLQPDKYCSYVYYHYIRQEEQPQGFNKYYIIGAHEHTIFSYQEWPATRDTPAPRGSLRTKLTPNNWQELMHEHFELWADQPPESQEWIRLPCIWQY